MKVGGSLARNARFDAPTCLRGKLQNRICFTVSKQVVMWFCVAGVHFVTFSCVCACVESFVVWQAQYLFASFSEDEVHFSWQSWHFGDLHRHFAWQAQHLRHVVLRALCETHCQGCVTW